MPELSCQQFTAWVTDSMGFSVPESTVYRILRREGLVKRPETRLAAGKEYHRKTTGPHQMWDTDASYFRVVSWGYYYLVTVGIKHTLEVVDSPDKIANTSNVFLTRQRPTVSAKYDSLVKTRFEEVPAI